MFRQCLCCLSAHNWLLKGMFMNTIFSLGIETFMEFIVVAYLNFLPEKPIYPRFLEIIGYYVTGFGMFLTCIVLPVSLLWHIARPPSREQLASTQFKETWGALFNNLKTEKRIQLAFYLMFMLRRAIFLLFGINATKSPGL